MKRLTIAKINEMVEVLKAVEATGSDYAENQRMHAAACLENYRVELESRGIRSVKLKERPCEAATSGRLGKTSIIV